MTRLLDDHLYTRVVRAAPVWVKTSRQDPSKKARSVSVSPSIEGFRGPPTVRLFRSLRGSPKGFCLQSRCSSKRYFVSKTLLQLMSAPGIKIKLKQRPLRRFCAFGFITIESDLLEIRRIELRPHCLQVGPRSCSSSCNPPYLCCPWANEVCVKHCFKIISFPIVEQGTGPSPSCCP